MAATGTMLMVAPEFRTTLASLELVRAYLAGPQDLSFCDRASESARRIFRGVGGTFAPLHSIRWILPLRPAQYALSVLKRKHRLLAALTIPANPLCRIMDSLTARVSARRPRPSALKNMRESLDDDEILECLSTLSARYSLRGRYDEAWLQWILGFLSQETQIGTLQSLVVRDCRHDVIGWCLYFCKRGGVSEVLHLQARREDTVAELLDHLICHAWKRGSLALSGRMDIELMPELWQRFCFLQGAASWVLVHSKNREILNAINEGDACISRLDGEWWINFPPYLTGPHRNV